MPSTAIPARWTPQLQGIARIITGFLLFRHGMEQWLGYPDAFRDAEAASFLGVLKLLAFPGGLLLMLGLFTRPVALALAPLYLLYWFAGPLAEHLQQGARLFGARGPSDPIVLNGLFLLYLGLTGAGAFSVDRLLGRDRGAAFDHPWAPYALGALRIALGFLFLHHGLEKVYGRAPLDPLSLRALAATLECVGGPLLMLGLFTRPLAFLLSGEMAVAYFMNHALDGFWGSFIEPNQEAAILNCYLFLFLWAVGPGAWSLDGLLRSRRRPRPAADPAVTLDTKAV